ncbi:MAG: N-acetylglucosamine-1-phosphate uridyltransferase [Oscillospiraceae bacterium]|nr:N-acetylglucosamine-1-phosphate uridyltransferase [Oscillospiraceae bacterium]
MKKHLTAALTALTMTASMLSAFPVQTTAAEEYLVRDKWGYCTTANYAESEHFVIFYGNNDTTGQVNDAFLKRNLENYEKLWHCYGEYLGMENMNVDIYGKSTQKYKTNVYLTYTGLDQYAEGWAFMSAEDGYGIEIISPNAMLDDLTIAHEFGHVVTMQQKAWVDQDITGAWWEPLANWFREMYLSSEYYTGDTRTAWFEPYTRNLSLTLPHGRNYYEVWPFLVYLSYNPDNLPGLGIDAVKRIISEANPGEYPFDTITRLFGTDAQVVFGHYAKRMATFDFGAREAYQEEWRKKLAASPFYWNLFYTVPEDHGTGWLDVPQEEAPMQGGLNVIPLVLSGDTVGVDLQGSSDDPNAAWQACIVTVDAAGQEHYSDLFGAGESMTASAAGAVSAYLTVAAMPKDLNDVNAFHKDNVSSCKDGVERRRYPYAIRLTGASVQQSGGYTKGAGHVHPNGGGWVADSASVADSVYVGPDAMVLGNAALTGNVRVEDHAVVTGTVTVQDHAVICGHAVVDGGGWVYDNGWKMGSASVSGNAVIGDSAVVTQACTISGNAKVLQKAYLAEFTTLTDDAAAKGMTYAYGKSVYSGSAVLDGDYCNEQTRDAGVGFGWLDDYGWHEKPADYVAEYTFDDETAYWVKDAATTTNARQSGAVWTAERTSAQGVLNFDGEDDCLILDESLLRTDRLQISLAALWKGGASQQELFQFGDDTAYMAVTPSNAQGVAELTLTDGTVTETLTASAPLPKGEWSKITVQILNGSGMLMIDGQTEGSKALTLTPLAVLGAAKDDTAEIGRGFKGALDYIRLTNQEAAEPAITYSGSEEPDDTPARIRGDVDANGVFELRDVILMQKWLTADAQTVLADWEAGDLCGDGKLDVFDLAVMKHELIQK